MALAVTVKSNHKKFLRRMTDIQKKQLPFAYSLTLNDSMKAVKKYTVARTFPRAFDVRSPKFFQASMFGKGSVVWASKKNLKVTATDRLDRGNLEEHARGGAKRVRWRVAIPTRYTKARRTMRGVPKRLHPRSVVESPKGYLEGDTIYQTYGAKGSKRRLLYVLKTGVRLRKRFPFYEDAERITRQVAPKLFKRNFARALKSAR